ncbi:MAG: FAD-dependent oxidoreductase [Bdellovibrionia bacterium]
MSERQIILVGGGHSHLEVLKLITKKQVSGAKFTLISKERFVYYSGMMPRLIMGDISKNELKIDLLQLATRCGWTFICDEVVAVNSTTKSVRLSCGDELYYDLLSLNLGGHQEKLSPIDSSSLVYLRPFSEFLNKWHEIQRICSICQSPDFIVVGGGAAAVEVAVALKVKLNKNHATGSQVHLVSIGQRLCEGYFESVSKKIQNKVSQLGVVLHLNEHITSIEKGRVTLKLGKFLQFNKVFVATPNKRVLLMQGKADDCLRLKDDVFVVGEGAELNSYPDLPRSGVVAVRQGQLLGKNILRWLRSQPLQKFKADKYYLNILVTSERKAALVWGPIFFEGRLPRILKDFIDKKYIKSFRLPRS